MPWIVPKNPQADEENKNDDEELNMIVCSQLQLKRDPNDKPGTLTKEAVLRRIRHRKRVNKFRSLLRSFFPLAKNTTCATRDHDITQNNH
ncbi:hypothetical protein AgCh_037761 [Apium graveolens]